MPLHRPEVGAGGSCLASLMCRAVLLLDACLLVLVTGASTFEEFTFVVEPSDVTVARGHSTVLSCSARHPSHMANIQWMKDGDFISFDSGSHRRALDNGSLYIESVAHSKYRPDDGLYQCVASIEGLGSIVSRKATLTIAYLEKNFQQEPQDLSVHLGDTAVFRCYIEGQPKPTVRWRKDEREIDSDSTNYLIHNDGTLEIASVQFSDFGRYTCEAENVERSRTSATATLSQNSDVSTYENVSPRFVMSPQDKTAIEGSMVTFYCAANGRDRQRQIPSITWLKDGVTIDMSNVGSRFSIVGQGSLRINNIQEEDSGSFTCRATNLEDSVDAEASLNVHVPPKFIHKPKDTYAHTSADVTFECEVDGVPKPMIQWLKNGDVVFPSDYFQIVDNRNLRVLGLVNSDAGIYQCLAENAVGSIQASAQLIIVSKDAELPVYLPRLTTASSRSPGDTGSQQGGVVPSMPMDLSAAIVSTRFSTLSWQLPLDTGSSEVTSFAVIIKEEGSNREREINTTRLEANIQHLKPQTRYVFKVSAINKAGRSEMAQIQIQTQPEVHVPGTSVNLKAVPLSSTSIRVSWDAPLDETEPITKYTLNYYKMGDNGEKEHDLVDRFYTLTDLHKFAEYSFRVVAHNSNGAGASTEEVVARTYSDVPSEPPQNVTLEPVSSSSIIVRWEPPPDDALNGIITGYKIRFKRKGGRGSDVVTTDGNRRTYALSELMRSTEYQVRLQALTVNGSSPATPWISDETFLTDLDESTVPGRPTSLRVRPFSDSVAVSWTPPAETNIMVRGYILGYGVGIPDVYKQAIDTKQRFHTIKNLQPSAEYVISLRAYNNLGEGRPIYETITTREETTPEPVTPMIPPVGLMARVLSPNTIMVMWSDATLGRNQRVTDSRYYTVRYSTKTARKIKYLNSTSLNIHIDDLKPNTEYEFAVKVIKGRRQSTWSMSVFNKTYEDAPATAPRDLTPVAVEGKPSSITLNWQPPRQPNGQVTGYLVFYTTDATQKDRDWVVEGVLGDKLSTTIRDLTPQTTYYFKVQARNSKGYGPMSPTVIFRTPASDGTGGGQIELPNDIGQPHLVNRRPVKTRPGEKNQKGIPPMVLWIVIGCVGGVTVIAIIVVTAYVCKRKSAERQNRKNGYKPANKVKGGPKDIHIKPPDLWIHDMEMKNLDKSQPETMTVSPIPRDTSELKSDNEGSLIDSMDKRNSFVSDHNYDSYDEDKMRRLMKPKPIMIPVEQPPPPREPIAMAIPNGHLLGGSGSMSDSGLPPRPLYPRTQYTPQPMPPLNPPYASSTPRVNLTSGDLSAPSSELRYASSTLERTPRHKSSDYQRRLSGGHGTGAYLPPGPQSPESPSTYNQHAPIPYEQLPSHITSPAAVDGSKSLPHRGPHPLKSFSVPGPPPQISAPTTPTPKHIVKPQQQTSPYKKMAPMAVVSSSSAMKARTSPMPPIITPKTPTPQQDTIKSGNSSESDLPKSYSAEELSAEMANLEGLMKDLNAITQQEFEC